MTAPIRVRMTFGAVALLAGLLAGVGAYVVLELRADLTAATEAHLRPAADRIAQGYRLEGFKDFRDASRTVLAGERAASQVLAPDGSVEQGFGDPVAGSPMLRGPGLRAVLDGARLAATRRLDGTAFRVVARPVTRRGRRRAIVVAESLDPVARSVRQVLVALAVAVPAALAAAVAGGWWLATRALRPVARMTAIADDIGVGRLGDRVPVPGGRDEVARLAATLNRMLDRIEQGVEAQRRLVADTSHELKTPLSAMRAEIDVSLREDRLPPAARDVLRSAREEVDRMSATVEDLLMLAAADEDALRVRRESVELRALAEEVAERFAEPALRRGVRIDVSGPPAPVAGDRERLLHAVRNLLDNALEHSPPGGRVTVSVACPGDGTVGLAVADAGPGVPPELRGRVFERFFRADPSRSRATGGSGLGLAIVRAVAAAHGGGVRVEDAQPHGAVFTLWLPAGCDQGSPVIASPSAAASSTSRRTPNPEPPLAA